MTGSGDRRHSTKHRRRANPGRASRRGMLALWLGCVAALAAPATSSVSHAGPPSPSAAFRDALDAWELDRAQAILDSQPDTPQRRLSEGVVLVYAARYAEAQKKLADLVAAQSLDDPDSQRTAQHYLDLATGALTALGDAPTVIEDPNSKFQAVFASPKDELLAPYFFDAMSTAYTTVGDAFGVYPDAPIRFEFLDDSAKLALVTPLSLDAIYTTGTIGITKYKRVMMISPRVMLQGYGWLDAAVHEYVHYVVTIRTHDLAPVWLQEGLAKYFEQSWRRSGAPELDESVAFLLHRAIERDELVTLEEMSPSIAMLPSRERAALAYAEVETMIGLLVEERGAQGLQALLDAVTSGADAKQAFAAAWGASFESFMATWKERTYARTRRAEQGELGGPEFKSRDDAETDPNVDPSLFGDVFSHLGGGKARQHARLGVLLTLRGHTRAAIEEYERARRADPRVAKDPKLSRRLGELYLEVGDAERAAPLLKRAGADDPENPNVAAAEGRALLRTGDREGARAALQRALRQNPFIPSLHCDLAELESGPQGSPERAAAERDLCSE